MGTILGETDIEHDQNEYVAKLAYSIPEAVYASGLGRTYLYGKIGAGELKSRKFGNRRIILREDLLEFLRHGH